MTGKRRLNVREQAAWMRNNLPLFQTEVTGRELICRGVIQPTPLSREYRVIIHYAFGHRPRVFVPNGQLRRRDKDESIPHTYADDEPCLYYPANADWTSEMKIATSIVSWLSLWLMYYEIWSATGEWLGGGVDHRSAEKPAT
ncbi:MAG: hypothetical protein LLG20_27835 [Acidobacteriales bacterium]|nr:hypothetical protein [Terriglobales bacterium]